MGIKNQSFGWGGRLEEQGIKFDAVIDCYKVFLKGLRKSELIVVRIRGGLKNNLVAKGVKKRQ